MGTYEPDPLPELFIIPSRADIKKVIEEAVEATLLEVGSQADGQRGGGVAVAICTSVSSLIESVKQEILAVDLSTVEKVGGMKLHL